LGCDTGSIFLVDSFRGELWTIASKDGRTIRLPIGNGIAGTVVK